jgi:hypothetical protein
VFEVVGILYQVAMFGLPTKHLETLLQTGLKVAFEPLLGRTSVFMGCVLINSITTC